MNKVKFYGEECEVKIGRYYDGNIRIELICEDGSPMAVASVNTDHKLNKGEVVIKNYSENTGMYEALLEADIITEALYKVPVGYATCPVVKLK